MERGKKNTIISVLVLFGFCIGFSDVFAQTRRKRTTTKKSSSSSALDKASAARSSAAIAVPTPVVEVPALTAAEIAANENIEVTTVYNQLLNCLAPLCMGDIDYEGCFNVANVPIKIAGDATCQGYLDNASSEAVRTRAINDVKSTIKGYFNEECDNAGGEVRGSTCQFKIYYHAKPPVESETKAVTSAARTYKIGDTVTCSYSAFGLSSQNMEYKEKASMEQQMAMLSAGIEAGMGALTTTFAVIDAVKTNNELKESEKILGDFIYKFDGTSLSKECAIVTHK